ncbi:MAG: hypothetical protein CFH32_00727 [Alphaproteobacteria bacterium MarineAlpha9_Bin2]|nr:MAG: hypothetical protein CFH31_00133 [Alphaproteobacteria bacterium MarineAlpha9_Bin1]PPR30419.1 MAG: hypothetical protein CFH32_00727 [Alphaproteobacteria bacterium MarineAlpha9_Bin2]
MQSIIYISILLVLLAVFIVLIVGIISMLRGGNFNKKWGNKLMRARVVLQALAVILILLTVIFFSR